MPDTRPCGGRPVARVPWSESAGRLVRRGRWMLVVLTLAVAVLAVPLGAGPFGRMGGGFEVPRTHPATSYDAAVLYRRPAVGGPLRVLPAAYRSTRSKDGRAMLPWMALVAGGVIGSLVLLVARCLVRAVHRRSSCLPVVEQDPLPSAGSGGDVPVFKRPCSSPVERRAETRPGWVRVTRGRTRVVRADPDGSGWTWVDVDT
ncbi:hypothetical protein [Nonomuraea sp. WAC 01424]|uniref:hypothetical protein n=1 Tax=Nonomuraea sp. WAC 01424 TaxID=2203200 RepID=UPI000F76E215|nr:hypothetical protein [Nonomuraea sp. WAC 01424]